MMNRAERRQLAAKQATEEQGQQVSISAVDWRRLLDSVTQVKSYGSLNGLALLLVGLFLVQAAFSFVQSYLLTYVGERIVYDLRTSLYNHLQRLSLDFYAVRRVGEIVSRLSSDVTPVSYT